jgi:type II secretory ATPase GspE/PulE/Tfp pilus assembly ATPase PilB-like protein
MTRWLLVLALVASAVFLGANQSCAQESSPWPEFRPQPAPGTDFRGPGGYLSWAKIIACWLVFMMWVRSADWVSRDGQEFKLRYLRWNPIIFGSFMAALLLLWLIPVFWVGFPLLLIAYVAPLATYIVQRHSSVGDSLRDQARDNLCSLFAQMFVDIVHVVGFVGLLFPVAYLAGLLGGTVHAIAGILLILVYPFAFVFGVLPQTHEQLSDWLAQRLGAAAGKEKVDPYETGPPVVLKTLGGPTERDENVRLLSARQNPGFQDARVVIADGLSHRAHAIMLDYAQQAVSVHWMVDGVWHPGEPLAREQGDPLIEALKLLAGLNPQDRRSAQKGTFGTEYESTQYASTLTCQGTKTGERVLMQFQDKKVSFNSFDEIGIRPKMQEELKELLALKQGLVLFAAMPGAGLRSTTHVAIRNTDRFTREFIAIEEETRRYTEIENCPVITYKAAEGQSPASVLPKVIRTMPDVIIVRDLVNAETVSMLCKEIPDERLIFGTVRAKESAEALLRILALGVPADVFAQGVSAVLSQRLIRKLCEACKDSYAPTPQILGQLGIPEGRVQAFFRPPQQPEKVCPKCDGVGYKERTAIFELLKVGDTVRKVLTTGPKLDLLRQAARKDGMRSLQEEGILLVAKGVTSLPELMRVLKQ